MNEYEQTNTVLVKVKPEADALVESFYQETLNLRETATIMAIHSIKDIEAASDLLVTIRNLKRTMEDKRKEYVSPLQGYVKAINDTFKGLMEPVEAADRLLSGKILAFGKAEEEKRKEQERINALRLEAAEAERALNGNVSEPVELIKPNEPLPERITTDIGEIGTRTLRKWELKDFSAVPDEYKTIDIAKIGKVVRAGIPSIPGIRIYEEKTLTAEVTKEPQVAPPIKDISERRLWMDD